jgi:transposase
LEKLADRVRAGRLKSRDKIVQAAERILSKNHGARYYSYTISSEDAFTFSECESFEQEKQIEGKYVIATSEKSMGMLDAIALYKDLANVEAAYRQLKDVLSMRPIYHQVEPRVKAHIFVATLALLVQRLLHQRLRESNIDFWLIRLKRAGG